MSRLLSRLSPAIVAVTLAACAALACAGQAAAQSAVPAAAKSDPRSVIAHHLDVPAEAVRKTVLPGIYEVARGGEVLYVSADGRYALSGELYETGSGRNLTERRRTEARVAALRNVPDSDAIVYTPKAQPRYTVTVFTDVDCPYCRKLHSEIAEYVKLGVRIRYLSFPRTGPDTESWRKAEAVWCAADRRDALTRATAGGEVAATTACADNPVKRSYELGEELGVRGTPAIFTERGEYLPSYYAPDRLIQRLKELDAAAGHGG
jgi:thiol:disulfide interchange protein DsbC